MTRPSKGATMRKTVEVHSRLRSRASLRQPRALSRNWGIQSFTLTRQSRSESAIRARGRVPRTRLRIKATRRTSKG